MKTRFREVFGLFQPLNLILAALAYSLGISIARYLGITPDRFLLLGGGLFVISTMAAAGALNAYFAPDYLFPKNIESRLERDSVLRFLLYLSITLLGLCALVLFYFILRKQIQPATILMLLTFALIALLVPLPPVRLSDRGFGEIALAVLMGGLPVSIAFILQSGTVHRLVSYFSFPILLLSLSYLLALEFPEYGIDLKYKRQSLLMRLTWQRAIPIHNILVMSAYIFFVVAPLVGIPLRLTWPPLLTLPLAVYQIIILRNIELGLKPNWRVLRVNAFANVGLVIYLLTFTFWIR